jgi:hypothetical protein
MDRDQIHQLRLEAKAREEEEETLRELGRSLREILSPGQWADLSASERESRVEEAHSAASEMMGIKQATTIEWTEDDSDEGAGFDEKGGVIEIPRHHLDSWGGETFAGLLGHELRHAWQWDVIEGRINPPGGAAQREWFKLAYDEYDTENRFKYAMNELEQDSRDRASYVIEGFRDTEERA